MRARVSLVVVGAALQLLCAAPAAAQEQQSLETAKRFFDEGQSLYIQGKYAEAVEKFQKAYDAKTFPAFLFNIAVCHEKNRDFQKSLDLYERYLKEDPHGPDMALVLKRIKAIREHLSPSASQPTTQPNAPPPNLPPVKTKGLVVIETKPEGAAIYLEDKKRGIFTRTPYTGSLPAGQHTVIVEMRKYKPERKTFYASNERMVILYFSLSSEEYLGWIEVKANVPGADVFFDKREVGAVGRTPYTGFLRPGRRQVIVEREGYAPYVRELEIVAGKDHVLNVALHRVSFGWLKVTGSTTEGATVKVDGKAIECKEPPCRTRLDEGTYKVELVRKGFKTYRQSVTVKQASETQLAVRLNPKPTRLTAYVTFGVHAALLVGAITTGVMSKNRRDSVQADLDAGRVYDSGDSRLSQGRIYAIVSNSLYGLSALIGGLGLYYLFRNEGPDSYGETTLNKIAITPSFGPQTAGTSGQVRF